MLIAVGKDAGVPVIVDTSGPALLRAADAGATVLKPNAAELVEATGVADPVEGARSLIARGTELVLLSLGAEGMLAVTATALVHARLDEPLAGNPTGAGDAGVAACAVLYADGVRDPSRSSAGPRRGPPPPCSPRSPATVSPRWPEIEQQLRISHPDPESFRKDPS